MQRSGKQALQALYNVEQASEYLGGISPHTMRRRFKTAK